jgi:hypothetical protein
MRNYAEVFFPGNWNYESLGIVILAVILTTFIAVCITIGVQRNKARKECKACYDILVGQYITARYPIVKEIVVETLRISKTILFDSGPLMSALAEKIMAQDLGRIVNENGIVSQEYCVLLDAIIGRNTNNSNDAIRKVAEANDLFKQAFSRSMTQVWNSIDAYQSNASTTIAGLTRALEALKKIESNRNIHN